MLAHARKTGGPGLRTLIFHNRARLIKALALHMNERKQAFYDISFANGATQADHMIGVDGGIGTMFDFVSKGRLEMTSTAKFVGTLR